MTDAKIIDTSSKKAHGQNKCPACGSTDIALNIKAGKLQCHSCRKTFDTPTMQDFLNAHLEDLQGVTIGSGAKEIDEKATASAMITLKCPSCGAEVVIDSSAQTSARCHWCRNTLSLNEQIPNGAVPDVVLPFQITKDEAKNLIEDFAGKRKFYAHPKFSHDFNTDSVMGVYLPYMMINENTHVTANGEGEIQTRSYEVVVDTDEQGNDIMETRYDADRYAIKREFDMLVEGLTIESSKTKMDKNAALTNNIINAIMPFDTEHALMWNPGFLKGYTSEKRDMNTKDLKKIVQNQTDDIARNCANQTIKQYDRGVHWNSCKAAIQGQQWLSAYLPVWLFSYQETNGDPSTIHYIAVNGRTKETMGSIPIYYPKLLLLTLLIEVVCFLVAFFVNKAKDWPWAYLLLASGLIYFFIIYNRYRNTSARHDYENVTKRKVLHMHKTDERVRHLTNLKNSRMDNANEDELKGSIY